MGLFNFFKKKKVGNEPKQPVQEQKPPTLKFTDKNGNEITTEELAQATGRYQYEMIGVNNASEEAMVLHNEARQFGQAGEYDLAIEKLFLAHERSPKWPYPLYDLAFTYMLKDDYDNALKYYQMTDVLAPNGFFTSKIAVFTLKKEQEGVFEKGLYRNYITLEWVQDPEQKAEFLDVLVTKFPNYAPYWKDYANTLDGEERINALEKGLQLDCDVETEGSLKINKALAIDYIQKDTEGAINILLEVIFDKSSTFGNVELAKFVLKNISINSDH
ncbi:tetratricopeptide repeat protein [Pseudotenacibaculum haliotis]|uniref:Tetratricopeptide repeat protein n=1 Tax=Pseudotenacibaculum haliotis TaxID=1862138 RepID=A0ABW5LN03_9FLAO